MKVPFGKLKEGDIFEYKYTHQWKNFYGHMLSERKTGRFEKIDEVFSYSHEDHDGIDLKPDDMVEFISKAEPVKICY